MKTELIYSKNRHEDIERALEQIEAFREHYRDRIETRTGKGTPFFRVLANRLRTLFAADRYRELSLYDAALQSSVEKLKDLREVVEISNTVQDIYQKYQGKMDIRVKPKGKKEFLLIVTTAGYSDDFGSGGSVRIPSLKREFRISEQVMERTFRRGAVDFSWLDGDLGAIAATYSAPPALTDKKGRPSSETEFPEVSFSEAGDNPVDLLD